MTAVAVDRKSPRWLRLRAACQPAARGIDLDEHTDRVWLTVENRSPNHTNAASSQSSWRARELAAEGA